MIATIQLSDRLWTLEEAGYRCGCSIRRLYRMAERGELKLLKVPGDKRTRVCPRQLAELGVLPVVTND